jgi:FMN phosphatase YigB (HAD superfamily)
MGAAELVALFDVDNTLIDNDTVEADLQRHLSTEFGAEEAARYWALYEDQRRHLGYADYLGALQRYRLELRYDPRLLAMSDFLLEYPFADRLFPGALAALAHVAAFARPVILSDGDAVFQPRKVRRSGLWDAVGGRVLVYIHKEQMLSDVEHWYPAEHYLMVDDKRTILAAVKARWSDRVTTVLVDQGHYARHPPDPLPSPAPDIRLDSVAALTSLDAEALLAAGRAVSPR